MVLLTHIIIALSSMLMTTLAYIAPSKAKLYGSAGLVALTLASGTYLVYSTHSNMLNSCISGLTYLSVVSIGLFAAQRKFAAERAYK